MDSFLFFGDYQKQIQQENLLQITGNNQSILDSTQRAAVEECASYLKNKYDISKALQPISQWDKTKSYKAGQTVYLNAPAYTQKTYALGSLTLNNGLVYINTTAITVAEAFTIDHWSLIGNQYDIYYAKYPNPVFDYKTLYNKTDVVFWKDKIYTCQKPTRLLDHEAQLQIGQANIEQIVNVFPDDAINGVIHWGVGASYSVQENTALSDSAWINDDNRDQKLLQICIDIALYHIHSRISPKNIPEFRVVRYMGNPEDRETRGQRILYPSYCSLGWLQSAAIGNDITPELPLIQPNQGNRIIFGGKTRNVNSY